MNNLENAYRPLRYRAIRFQSRSDEHLLEVEIVIVCIYSRSGGME